MLKLIAVQARFGDCFLLVYGNDVPRYILIDGGPSKNFDKHLKDELTKLQATPLTLDCVIISHVDNDHILGVLGLLAKIKFDHDNRQNPFCKVEKLWFNSFSVSAGTQELEGRINSVYKAAGANNIKMQEMNMALHGISEGHKLTSFARFLDIPINPEAADQTLLADKTPQVFHESNLEIIVVGPTKNNLTQLKEKWEEWVAANEAKIQAGAYTPEFAAMQDKSIPNLSSIVLLIRAEGKSILLTGDCRGDHLVEGIIETGLSADGKLHVDIFKVPHHGSARNVTKEFFGDVTADTYIISADGTYGNPDYETLTWIVESAKEVDRKIEIFFTNHTEATDKLLENYPTPEWGYDLRFMEEGQHSMQIL